MKQELSDQLAEAREGISPRSNAEDLYEDADTELMHGESYLPANGFEKKHLYMIAGAGIVGLLAARLLFPKKRSYGEFDKDTLHQVDKFVKDRYGMRPKRGVMASLAATAGKAAFAAAAPHLKNQLQNSLTERVIERSEHR